MSPAESRKARPDLWDAYDRASAIGCAVANAKSVTVTLPDDVIADVDPQQLVEVIDLARALLRARIETDAAAGKAGAP
ncbi:MAG: hypothetical protein MUF34_38270 [Polyangiaceae bacterium]|jgi:hypothetical protein|nr:hypothetical protein [Polyangiaceae bacterium]